MDNYYSYAPSKKESGISKFHFRLIAIGLVVMIVLLVFIIGGVLIWRYAFAPHCLIENFFVHTEFTSLNEEEQKRIQAISGIVNGTIYSDVDPKRIEEKLLSALPIKAALVEKHFPSTVEITLTERIPIVLALYHAKDGENYLMSLDSEGYLIEVGENIRNYDLPFVSGNIEIPSPNIGSQVKFYDNLFFKKIEEIKRQKVELYNSISEIEVRTRGGGNYDLCIFFRNREYPCVFASNFKEDNLLNGLIIEESISKMMSGKKGYAIDFRTKSPTFCPLEDKE